MSKSRSFRRALLQLTVCLRLFTFLPVLSCLPSTTKYLPLHDGGDQIRLRSSIMTNFWSFRRKRSLAQHVYERPPLSPPPERHTVYFVFLRCFLERLHCLHAQRSVIECVIARMLILSQALKVRSLPVKRTALKRDNCSRTGNLRPRCAAFALDF